MVGKPTKEEVVKYAKPIVYKFIGELACDLPPEQKEEIEQEAYLRLMSGYQNIDPTLGWKSFVYNHCRGAVLDYLKFGKGFAEQKWSILKEEEEDARHRNKIKHRVSNVTAEGEDADVDQILGNNDVYNSFTDPDIKIRWNLVARMATTDKVIHAMAKRIRGFEMQEIADVFGITKAQANQLIMQFVERLDDPDLNFDPWVLQTIYAFGLCRHFSIKEVDQSIIFGFPIGWNAKAADLDSDMKMSLDEQVQLSFFDVG